MAMRRSGSLASADLARAGCGTCRCSDLRRSRLSPPARRGDGGKPHHSAIGPVVGAAQEAPTGSTVAELARPRPTRWRLRGPMVPRHAFPPGIEGSGQPYFAIGRDGALSIPAIPAGSIRSARTIVTVTGPPSGIIDVGGYRFRSLSCWRPSAGSMRTATLAALPDPLVGPAADRHCLRPAMRCRQRSPPSASIPSSPPLSRPQRPDATTWPPPESGWIGRQPRQNGLVPLVLTRH